MWNQWKEKSWFTSRPLWRLKRRTISCKVAHVKKYLHFHIKIHMKHWFSRNKFNKKGYCCLKRNSFPDDVLSFGYNTCVICSQRCLASMALIVSRRINKIYFLYFEWLIRIPVIITTIERFQIEFIGWFWTPQTNIECIESVFFKIITIIFEKKEQIFTYHNPELEYHKQQPILYIFLKKKSKLI